MIICIDPGHAGIATDPGAVGAKSKECEINLAIAEKLDILLRGQGHKTVLTRSLSDDPDSDSLRRRCETSNQANADIFVSLHCNGFYTSQAHGFEVWFYEKSYKGKQLAQALAAKLKAQTPLANRGAKGTYQLYVLNHTNAPAVLVETGFITNPADEEYLTSATGQQTIARAICDALCL